MSVLKIENKTFIVTSKEKTLACLITAAWTSNSWLYFVCNFLRTSSKESTERSNKISANISLIYVACRDTFTSLHYSDLKKTEAEQIPDNEGTNVDLFRTQKWKWIFFRSCKNELIKLLQSENWQPFSVYFHYKLNIFGLWMKQDNCRPNLWDIKKFYKLKFIVRIL